MRADCINFFSVIGKNCLGSYRIELFRITLSILDRHIVLVKIFSNNEKEQRRGGIVIFLFFNSLYLHY